MTKIQQHLSKQQKAILKVLADEDLEMNPSNGRFDKFVEILPIGKRVNALSLKIAREFNGEYGDRMNNRKEKLEELVDRAKEGNNETDVEEDITNVLGAFFHEGGRHKNKVLTSKHRASFSRSLKRLEDKGLIERVYDTKFDSDKDNARYIKKEENDCKTQRAILTERGREVAREVKRRVEDDRYSLEFETL
ncbi:hypothetical protein AKJ51_04325 [candidate division MSBL1 archaeon SCGC-AAA382A20]|uniref:Uncharacterized protein n=1 Tax=candidate division MSBL1 archaeon SCGC-AAA382A20 TaxID=1698280 RepID=A0A133VHX7_9EURY|nr:hypothetical protein AKJ51_04325 [candidate division MSBL1 archaeon SCGC-AAA382A20]